MNVTRKATTIRLPDYMLIDLHNEAHRAGVSMNKLIEDTIEKNLYRPNVETLAAIEEARSGVEMEEVDLSSFDAFIKSMEE